tara:strand:- start:211 stop:687 length:477 start_codon:yes stop_codon:yes gene_type:complete
MSETTLLESRLSKVEQDNRRLKLALGALLLALAAVPLVGAVMPEQIPELIQARRFRVIDENGTTRAVMDYDGFYSFDENGKLRAAMDDLSIRYMGENGNGTTDMGAYGFSYYGESGTLRAQLGRVVLKTPATGAETKYPAQVVLYDDDFNVLWSAVGR